MSLINLNQLNIIDSISITPDGSVPIAIQFGDNIWSGNYAGGMLVPTGITADRFATPSTGYFRYNTDLFEFEGFTNSDWRPTGQLTQDGDDTDPSRSFVSDTTTGSYLVSSGTYGITANGSAVIEISATNTTIDNNLRIADGTEALPSLAFSSDSDTGIYSSGVNAISITTNETQRVEISDTNTSIKNQLVFEGNMFAGPGVGDMETTTTQTVTLLANQTDTVIAAPLTYDGATYDAVMVDYLVQRDVGSAIGTLRIVNDGTLVSLADTNTSVNSTGITFTATITTGTVEVKYTSTAGNDATMKYVVRRWGI